MIYYAKIHKVLIKNIVEHCLMSSDESEPHNVPQDYFKFRLIARVKYKIWE